MGKNRPVGWSTLKFVDKLFCEAESTEKLSDVINNNYHFSKLFIHLLAGMISGLRNLSNLNTTYLRISSAASNFIQIVSKFE